LLASVTAEIVMQEQQDGGTPELEVKVQGAEEASVTRLFKGFVRHLENALRLDPRTHGRGRIYTNRSRLDDEGRRVLLDIAPDPDSGVILALASALLTFGVRSVRMPVQFGGRNYEPPPVDESDPFADVAEPHPDFDSSLEEDPLF
jgi:hypothetical protein